MLAQMKVPVNWGSSYARVARGTVERLMRGLDP